MKRGLLLTIVVFALMMLISVVPMSAAPQNAEKIPSDNATPDNSINQLWMPGPSMCFDLTRIDGEFYAGTGKVYFLGGRSGTTTVGNIYQFDPVTNQCTDTGVLMPTPISNYTVNLVNNGTTDLLCTFGGRNAAGGTTLDVQCYDPNANTASIVTQLPAAWTGYTPSSQVVVDNVVYIFGGFNSTTAPYMTARTEAYDPVANSFTQKGDLNLARSYIMATAVDGIIYAFGGDTFDGSALIAQTIAEKMDPAVGTWDDAGVADLPVAGDEGQAFGFDSTDPYVYANKIIIATLSQWSGSSAEVILYDVGTNTYDDTFADLTNARRNHAGVFVPLNTPDPIDGLPGMWVFGGWFGSDNPPYAPAEFYPMEELAGECNVLLVDDDWDQYSGEPYNGTGTYYYTSTLESLGYDYSRWDVWTQGDPGLSDMDPYDVVLWFTGYAWEGTITETNELDLAAYLDGGGRLILSAEDYIYEMGLTTFGETYLGITNFTEDVTDVDVIGNTGDPIGDGLGPYTLVVPTSWPVSGEMYPDYVTPLGNAPFSFQASAETNSTDMDEFPWKSAFLAWPLEGLDDLADREAVFGAALSWLCQVEPAYIDLSPTNQMGDGYQGSTVAYTLTLTNLTAVDDTFNITYDALWNVTGPASLDVLAGESLDFVVNVTVPTDAICDENDLATVTATSDSNAAITDSAYITTGVIGDIQGTFTDANTGLGIADAHLYFWRDDTDFNAWTDADGEYMLTGIRPCVYEGNADAMGYFDQYGLVVDMTADNPTILDLTLDASWPFLTEVPISVVIPPDRTDTLGLTLENMGTGDLEFHVTEVPSGTYEIPLYIDTSMPSGVDAKVYSDLAASPDGTAKFIVYLKQQADLSAAFGMSWEARGQYVLDTLKAAADQTQVGLRAELDKQGVAYQPHYIANALIVTGNLTLAESLASRPEVGFIGPNMAYAAPAPVAVETSVGVPEAIGWNISKISADMVWDDLGVTGEGIVVSNIDTGVQWEHPALMEQYRGWDGSAGDHDYNWWDPYNQNPLIPTDADGHGTHTMGTMVGSDDPTDPLNAENAIGVAPGAQWIACDGFDNFSGSGYDAELLECAEFLLAPWDLTGANPDPDMRPDVINNSWGGGPAQWWYNQAIYAWRAAGIMGVFSGGNAGPGCATVHSPSDYNNIISVGATTSADVIASFSSRGPADISGIRKPDVSAPGASVRSSVPDDAYALYSGTSMAAPHVAGSVALIWAAEPDLRGDVQLTQWVLEQSAFGITSAQGCGGDLPDAIPNNVYGWGRINVYDAVTLAMGTDWDIDWLEVEPVGGTISPGAEQEILLTFDTTGLTFGECYMADLKFEYNDPYVTEQFVPVELCIGNYTFKLPLIMK